MLRRRQTRPAAFLALAGILLMFAAGAAQAQGWSPWQSYGEAEEAARARQKQRAAKPGQAEIDKLKKQVDQLNAAGKYAEATTAQQRVVKLTEKRYGPNDPQTAAALTALADLYTAQQKFAEAEPLLKRAIDIREKAKKPDNGEVAQALDNLGSLYVKQGRTADAAPLAKRAADLRANVPVTPATPAAPAASTTGGGENAKQEEAKEAEKKPDPAKPESKGGAKPGADTDEAAQEAAPAAPSESQSETMGQSAPPPADAAKDGGGAREQELHPAEPPRRLEESGIGTGPAASASAHTDGRATRRAPVRDYGPTCSAGALHCAAATGRGT